MLVPYQSGALTRREQKEVTKQQRLLVAQEEAKGSALQTKVEEHLAVAGYAVCRLSQLNRLALAVAQGQPGLELQLLGFCEGITGATHAAITQSMVRS